MAPLSAQKSVRDSCLIGSVYYDDLATLHSYHTRLRQARLRFCDLMHFVCL